MHNFTFCFKHFTLKQFQIYKKLANIAYTVGHLYPQVLHPSIQPTGDRKYSKNKVVPCVVVHACHPSTQVA
jgi:hypothetical protein